MACAEHRSESDPVFTYHLLRNALDCFSRNLVELDASQTQQVRQKASKSYALESMVLGTPEARGLVIPEVQLDAAFDQVASRYASAEEFQLDLQSNGLDADGLRNALRRELRFDAVMQRVAARSAEVNDIDLRLFYEVHASRFETPETRKARHILITLNEAFVDNTRAAAQTRMQQIIERLGGRGNRFGDLAKRYSECPTAMEGGKLGEVRRGALYPQLDKALFALQEGEISAMVESELGFHLIYCEKIKPAKRHPFSRVAPNIRSILEQRRRRNCQKAWLAELQGR